MDGPEERAPVVSQAAHHRSEDEREVNRVLVEVEKRPLAKLRGAFTCSGP
jgi:hypothetical protein